MNRTFVKARFKLVFAFKMNLSHENCICFILFHTVKKKGRGKLRKKKNYQSSVSHPGVVDGNKFAVLPLTSWVAAEDLNVARNHNWWCVGPFNDLCMWWWWGGEKENNQICIIIWRDGFIIYRDSLFCLHSYGNLFEVEGNKSRTLVIALIYEIPSSVAHKLQNASEKKGRWSRTSNCARMF